MPRILGDDFDYYKEELDPNEIYIRDQLKVNMHGWSMFRNLINGGTYSDCLVPAENTISDEIRQAFIELGKANYEVINCIGFLKDELNYLAEFESNLNFFVRKSTKQFYFHFGCLFDNLARIIYIVNHPDAATATGEKYLKRHTIDWGKLQKWQFRNINSYMPFFEDSILQEIFNLRNNLTHNWHSIFILKEENGAIVPHLPLDIRYSRNYLWHYEERTEFEDAYGSTKRLYDFIKDDYCFIEKIQNEIYFQIVKDLKNFESNNKVEIK